MNAVFDGASLRLARVFSGLALEEVAERVGKTRQYLHKLETGQGTPTEQLMGDLAEALDVEIGFFGSRPHRLNEDQFHFRKLMTTKSTIKQVAIARGEMIDSLIKFLDQELRLPQVSIPSLPNSHTFDEVERAAEYCRKEWDLGLGPIANMTRLVENLGAVVTTFQGVSKEIDALSVSVERPFIVRNTAKESACRQRFDIAHELGHLVMHEGVVTGDRVTENQANRFASALLLPRSMMAKLFPRPTGTRLDWKGIKEFKLTWKVSKAGILFRAKQLDLITESQYKTGVITLRKYGETNGEREDHLVAQEPPEMLARSLFILAEKKGINALEIAKALHIKPAFLKELAGLESIALSSPPQIHPEAARHLRLVK
ncbi:Zn-dependent peptidase ImmA (M78 family) [Pseudomonas sp. SJZ103]|uniref:helix-turn-helix domain-containing protein n=1 Tax=unclassified Pseudomonas TaxID=196821 RepID=UPI0011AAAC0B|nr:MULTISPECIES: XRE family transcriptional regulator [unclassified Pseudomonas]TWC74362.1 Zn-dependent peptidase ImmA (M78 family) [Pseudomonas sp. SJZ103]TWC93509.1 Zn-dependent peptidase ImmA (M78 family) [Pseudomonas sp. SJZ094]